MTNVPHVEGDTHMEVWENETATDVADARWLAWIDEVEHLLGHTADGDGELSLDAFYERWEKGQTPQWAVTMARQVTVIGNGYTQA